MGVSGILQVSPWRDHANSQRTVLPYARASIAAQSMGWRQVKDGEYT